MRIEDVSGYMERGTIVEHNRCKYYISACITRYSQSKGWWYQLELHDLKANSVTITDLDKVEIQEV